MPRVSPRALLVRAACSRGSVGQSQDSEGIGPDHTIARKEILQFAAAQRWPVIAITRQWVEDGALLCYGSDSESQWRRAAYFVDRILCGTKPGDLPIELPTTFEMGVNLKTAKALGITLPPEILVRATLVIE